jgi:FlaG/FlaF family flagellin (archaellin)
MRVPGNVNRGKNSDAVSPVVGVMLMLVVTIIIAAVVSAFAGGMTKDTEKAPTASMEIRISNDGTWGGSNFHVDVLAVSEAIPTKDIKIVTEWKSSSGARGGATVTGPNMTGANTHYGSETADKKYQSLLGFGPGVNQWMASGNYYTDQHFGNYSLMAGTRMHNSAAGYNPTYGGYGVSPGTRYEYSSGSYHLGPGEGGVDAMMAILGPNWYELRPGDIVHVRFIHIPSGKLIYDKDVTVEG